MSSSSTKTAPRVVTALRDGLVVSIPEPGVPLGHYLGVAAPAGRIFNRGEELTLTDDVLTVNKDRNGSTPWDDLTGSTKWLDGPLGADLELEAEIVNKRDRATEDSVPTSEYIQVIAKTERGRKLLREAVIDVYRVLRP